MIRPAREEDCEGLSSLEVRSKAVWDYPGDWMAVFRDELLAEAGDVTELDQHVLERDGRLAGYYMLKVHSADLVELEHMFVEPELIRQGFGSALMVHAIGRSRERGFRTMKIIADPHASGFYEHHGAVPVGEHQSSIPGRAIPILELEL